MVIDLVKPNSTKKVRFVGSSTLQVLNMSVRYDTMIVNVCQPKENGGGGGHAPLVPYAGYSYALYYNLIS